MNCNRGGNMDQKRAQALQHTLLEWYHTNKRDLPWRRCTEPYSTWICEIMAQQTRITALLPYYERFLTQFPDVHALASAQESGVLKAWEGLGYYSRARSLHKAAMRIVSEFGGRIPDEESALLSLPGIGEYTAGAILSIAFGQPIPAVDGNVLRVYARVECDGQDISTPQAKKDAKAFVASCMPAVGTGFFTQALMELGALVCVPKTPQCPLCPLSSLCRAFQKGAQGDLPQKPAKKAKKEKDVTVLLLMNEGGAVMMHRREQSLLRGMWEFVTLEHTMNEGAVAAHLSELGFQVQTVKDFGAMKHVFTHIIWHMNAYFCRVAGSGALPKHNWVPKIEVSSLAIPTAFRGYAEKLFESGLNREP